MNYVWNNNYDATVTAQIAYKGSVSSSVTYMTPFVALQSGDVQFWFECSGGDGRVAYDSQFGRNYHFLVYPAKKPSELDIGIEQ